MKIPQHIGLASGITAALSFAGNQAAAEDEWEFAIAPLYLWGKSIEADTSAGGRGLPVELEFRDEVLENLDAAFAVHFEARKGKLTLFAEYNYSVLDPTVRTTVGPFQVRADVDFTDIMAEGGVTYAFAESDTLRWEAIGGLRYYKQHAEVKFSSNRPGIIELPNKLRIGDSWAHPFAGVRVIADVGERWTLRLRGDYGYENSDNSAVQGIATLNYRFRDWGSAFFGYRYYDMDFDNDVRGPDQYSFDGAQQGPLLGLTIHF